MTPLEPIAFERPRRPPVSLGTFVGALLVCLVASVLVVAPRTICGHEESKQDVAEMTVRKYAYEAYPAWRDAHPEHACPASLGELGPYMDRDDTIDPWGTSYAMQCDGSGIAVASAGEDGRFGTDDDVRCER